MECHQTYPGPLAILPNGAIDDYNWHFYSYSPWWQDVVSIHSVGPDGYLAPTGPRLPNPPPDLGGPTTFPVPGPGGMISKPVSTGEEEKTISNDDARRDFQRRKEATEEPNKRDTKRRAPQKK